MFVGEVICYLVDVFFILKWGQYLKRQMLEYRKLMVTSVTKGGTQKFPKQFKIVKHTDMTIHWKSSWESLSDGTIRFSIQPHKIELGWTKFLSNTTIFLSMQDGTWYFQGGWGGDGNYQSISDQSEVCMSIFICEHVLVVDSTCYCFDLVHWHNLKSYAQEINFFYTIDLKNTFLLAKGWTLRIGSEFEEREASFLKT
jgi:hypothetical protein